jgi:hypothetical protein
MAGRFDDARTLIARDRELLDELGLGPLRIHTAEVASWIELRAGDGVAAEAAARDGLAAAEEFNDRLTYAEFASLVARALALQGRDEEVLELTELAAERGQGGDVAVHVQWRIARAPALGRLGRAEEAVALAREAVEAAAAADFLPLRADAVSSLGGLLGSGEILGEARRLYELKGDTAGLALLDRTASFRVGEASL